MSWHREHPELTGTSADPWMMHASYRAANAETMQTAHRRGEHAGYTVAGCSACVEEASSDA